MANVGIARAGGLWERCALRCVEAILCAAALFLLCLPSPAQAATFSNRLPAPGTTVTSNGYVYVTATYAGGTAQYGMTVDGVTIWPWQLNITRPNATTMVIRTLGQVVYQDGPHTVRVTLTDSTGAYQDIWTYSAHIKPVVSAPYPAQGASVGVPRPSIGVRIADNTPGQMRVRLRIDGAEVFNSLVNQGDWRYTPTTDFANSSSHTAVADVSDAYGNTSSLTWSFSVAAAPAMTVPPACTGASCHPTYPAAHPMDGCETCHYARADITPGPNHDLYYYGDDVGCLDCHEPHTQRDPARWFCDTCHLPSSPSVTQHTAANTATEHVTTATACDQCHDTDLLVEHSLFPKDSAFKNQCDTCHASSDTRVRTAIAAGDTACTSCHVLGAEHEAHPALLGTGWIPIFDNHDGLGAIGSVVECSMCHGAVDLIAAHDGECQTCHSAGGPLASFSEWNGSCQQGTCHVTTHSSADAAHTAIAFSECERCHEPDWSVTQATCAGCHSASESVAPVTSSNSKAAYKGAASIVLKAVDPVPASGVDSTFYRLDDGAAVAGTELTVEGPSSGTQAHELEFWSVDNLGNVEAARVATFSIAADDDAPVTTSNAVASYIGVANILLHAVDNGSTPVSDTYYRVDGGVATRGTTLCIPGPASGSQVHELEFWSVDAVGTEEFPHKTAAFTIEVDALAPATTSNAPLYDKTFGPLRVDFTATDADPGSGVAHTNIKVNVAAPYQGTSYLISNTGVNTIEFWSIDKAGNVELPHKTATVIKDPWAPTTVCDAQATYVESASVHLTPADTGAAGVASTFYTVDGGTQTSGTTIGVTAIGTHTLRYWSVDRAGNVEAVKTTVVVVKPSVPAPAQTGTVIMRWDDPPAGSWTYYYVYDAAGGLITSGYNTTGTGTFTLPMSAQPYTLKAYWFESEEICYPVWSNGTALIDTPGKTVTWWY